MANAEVFFIDSLRISLRTSKTHGFVEAVKHLGQLICLVKSFSKAFDMFMQKRKKDSFLPSSWLTDSRAPGICRSFQAMSL